MKTNVVITGSSCITPLGKGIEQTWQGLLNQKCGITPITKFDANNYRCSYAGEIKEPLSDLLPSHGRSMMTYQNQLMLWCIIDAWQKSDIVSLHKSSSLETIPLYFGNGSVNLDARAFKTLINLFRGNCHDISMDSFSKNIEMFPPLDIIKTMATASSHFASKTLGVKGRGNPIFSGDTSSMSALIQAGKSIEAGTNEIAIVASAENVLIPHYYCYLSSMENAYHNELSSDSSKLSRPFDNMAKGVIYSEGAACIILESEKNAIRRQQTPLAKLLSSSINLFPGKTPFELNRESFEKNIHENFTFSSLSPKDINVIFPFSPSYLPWDSNELMAIDSIFQNHDYQLSSVKGNIGYTASCSGLIDTTIAIKCLTENKLFDINNFLTLHPALPKRISDKINNIQNNSELKNILISNAGLGGFYASIIVGKWNST